MKFALNRFKARNYEPTNQPSSAIKRGSPERVPRPASAAGMAPSSGYHFKKGWKPLSKLWLG
jgi:hypothetical protein